MVKVQGLILCDSIRCAQRAKFYKRRKLFCVAENLYSEKERLCVSCQI